MSSFGFHCMSFSCAISATASGGVTINSFSPYNPVNISLFYTLAARHPLCSKMTCDKVDPHAKPLNQSSYLSNKYDLLLAAHSF